MLLHATPELVDTSAYTVNYIARIEDESILSPENGAVNFAWLTRDIAPSGVMGDPRGATAENGRSGSPRQRRRPRRRCTRWRMSMTYQHRVERYLSSSRQ